MILCSKAQPWNPRLSEPGVCVQHQDAYEEKDDGDTCVMYCPVCGTRWRMELPQ